MIYFSDFGEAAATTDPHFASTKLLLGFNGTDGATSTSDESSVLRGANTTVRGNAQLDTAQFKFGSASYLGDGAGDVFVWNGSTDWVFGSGQFTVECWVRHAAAPTGFEVYAAWYESTTNNRSWIFCRDPTGHLVLGYSTTGANDIQVVGSVGPTAGQWDFCAVDCDSGGTIRLYLNGTMVGSAARSAALFSAVANFRVGAYGNTSTTDAGFMNGWIDELRITKGVARYASNAGHTVPTAAFPRS